MDHWKIGRWNSSLKDLGAQPNSHSTISLFPFQWPMAMHGDLRFPLEAFALLLQQIFPKTMELSTIRRARIRLLVDKTLGWNMMKWVSCWARCFLKMWRGEVLGSSHFTRLVGWWFFEVIESQEEVEEVVSVNLFGGLGSHCHPTNR